MQTEQTDLKRTAQIIGYLGLLPFATGLVALFLINDDSLFILITHLIVYYSAVIIVFVSAVHWGYVISNNNVSEHSRRIIISIIPSLLACIFLMLPTQTSLACFFFCFILWQKYEETIQAHIQFPDWYVLLRKHLSYTVAALLLLAWLICLNA